MRLRHVLKALTLSLIGMPSIALAEAKPNIVIILTDDQGYADVSYNPHSPPEVSTPNIDALAHSSIICTQGYTSRERDPPHMLLSKNLTMKTFISFSIFCLSAMAATAAHGERPNIIMFLIDDQNPSSIAAFGGDTYTPNLDRRRWISSAVGWSRSGSQPTQSRGWCD